MAGIRTSLQGIGNIIRFNWHFYVTALAGIITLLLAALYFRGDLATAACVVCGLIILSTIISLAVSWYVYDRSGLYAFDWLRPFINGSETSVTNIHAGFDETSGILQSFFPGATMRVFDFYDPEKHTEISIKRARAIYPAYPGTEVITTNSLPVDNDSTDLILLLFAAHEIRNDTERIAFFTELHRKLKDKGRIIVVEHLRDGANFFAYNIGFFHFHPAATWKRTFADSGFVISRSKKLNPFVSLFILEKA